MITITFQEINISWMIFWITYWIMGSIMSYYSYKKRFCKIIRLKEVIITVLINSILGLIGAHIAILLPIGIFNDLSIPLKYIGIIIFAEIWFHHSHLLLHHPFFYKRVHKKHHDFIEPYALVSVYCTISEFFICNFPTVVIAPILFNITGYYLYIWVFLASLDVTLAHSRLFNFKIYSNLHDLHHKYMNCNYGVIDIFDRLYGTRRTH